MPEIGRIVSHYRIVEKIGQGGMGEVYLADDTTLDRKVALKFLPEAFTRDPERMARFEREAKLLASLNHPNIAGIHGLEQADGNRFLVLEYVEGETLQARLSKGALPLEDALALCRQIAEGLEAAHEKGVIHRDLKPANVMITSEEKVKILDFGLAKALSDETQSIDSSQSPTLTEAMTRPGVILGTAAYMSPEQAKGKSVDKRADIWAFGCILYECLTGRKAFEGETVTETLAAVIKGEPVLEKAPAKVQQLLRQCLVKDRKSRLRDIGDAMALINGSSDAARSEAILPKRIRPAWSVAAVLLVTTLAFAWLWVTREIPVNTHPATLSILPPEETSFKTFAISPNGRYLAFIAAKDGKDQLWIRSLETHTDKVLPGTESASYPVWSPDSRFIAFFEGNRIKKIEASGGPIRQIGEETQFWRSSWNRDGDIIFNGSTLGLLRVSAEGGEVSVLTAADIKLQESDHRSPSFLPDGRHFVYHIASRQKDIDGIYLGSMDGSVKEMLIKGATSALYASSGSGTEGYLVFKQENALMAQPFDAKQLKLTGTSFLVADHAGNFSASDNGFLVFNPNIEQREPPYVWVNREGQYFSSFGIGRGYFNPQLSPDGKRIVVDRINEDRSTDIWIYDEQGKHGERITFDPALDISPVWSADGSSVIFASNRNGNIFNLYQKSVTGTQDEKLLRESSKNTWPIYCSKEGRFLLFQEGDPNTAPDIGYLTLEGESQSSLFLNTEAAESLGRLSPNGLWLAYQSDESGRDEIYIQKFPEGGSKRQISSNGGMNPQWRQGGKELFYYADGKLMTVQVKPRANMEIDFEPAVPLFDYPSDAFRLYTASADGQRFLITQTENNTAAPLTVIINWTSKLKK